MSASAKIRKMLWSIELRLNRSRTSRKIRFWKNNQSQNASLTEIHAHVLLMQKVEYVDLALTCVYSFLYYHPRAKFTFHCDEKTIGAVNSKFDAEIKSRIVLISLVRDEIELPWQEVKLGIILSMNGTCDLMLDADLRWNSPLPPVDTPTFLVKEFDFRDKSPFREIARQTKIQVPHASMKNVSVFSFGGYRLTPANFQEIRDSMLEYGRLVDSETVGNLDRSSIGRVVEQFVLSLCSETWATTLQFVKETDRPLDGGIVESCYFGATGGNF